MLKAFFVDHKATIVSTLRPHVIHQIGLESVLIVQVVFVKASFALLCGT
jgi:hypothetical protein